jgi:nucleotide-binding universal stress UspA family protein
MSQGELLPRFQHILFPVDFSERSRSVVPFVKAVASHFRSKVTLLYVIKPPERLPGAGDIFFDIPLWSSRRGKT